MLNGYLRLSIPLFGKIYPSNIRHNLKRKWNAGQYIWDDDNEKQSLHLAQKICKIQHYLHQLNEKKKSENKLILNLDNLNLYNKHQNFLDFWRRPTDYIVL